MSDLQTVCCANIVVITAEVLGQEQSGTDHDLITSINELKASTRVQSF